MRLASFDDSGTAGEPACNTIRYFTSVEIAAVGYQIAKISLINQGFNRFIGLKSQRFESFCV
jgi:hypothetical protein